MRQDLVRRLAKERGANNKLRVMIEQTIGPSRTTERRLALIEDRINESAGQYAILNSTCQALIKNRTDWLLSVNKAHPSDRQQLQLSRNAAAAISAQQMAAARLTKLSSPHLSSC